MTKTNAIPARKYCGGKGDGFIFANPDGQVSRYEYDALGRRTKAITPMGLETLTGYDANGNPTRVTDADAVTKSGTDPNKNDTGMNIFSVYLQKVYDDTSNQLASQSYSISNDIFTAGGGWVDGSKTLSLADTDGKGDGFIFAT